MITPRDWIVIITGIIIVVAGGYLTHVFSAARQRIEEKFMQIEKKLEYIETTAERCREDLSVNKALDNERKEVNSKLENKIEKIEEKLTKIKYG